MLFYLQLRSQRILGGQSTELPKSSPTKLEVLDTTFVKTGDGIQSQGEAVDRKLQKQKERKGDQTGFLT
jgi:hypothetical protein